MAEAAQQKAEVAVKAATAARVIEKKTEVAAQAAEQKAEVAAKKVANTEPVAEVIEVENDGNEEAPSATLIVSKRSDGKYKFSISSNIANDTLVISATRKGSKIISFNVKTNKNGNASIITSRNLSGFALTLRYNGESLDTVKVK